MIERIHIIGAPGSGKTWLARHLAMRLSAPVCDLDDLFWDKGAGAYGTRATPVVRDGRLRQFIGQPRWIVEGVYHQWVEESFRGADLIIALTPSVYLRDWRIIRRFLRRKMGVESSKKESVRNLVDLLKWNHGYDGDNLRRAMMVLEPYRDKLLVCRGSDEALEKCKGAQTLAPALPQTGNSKIQSGVTVSIQEVMISFTYGQRDLNPLFALEDELITAIEAASAGMFDGDEIAVDGSDGRMYMYGPDADRLFEAIRPILASATCIQNVVATIRYGPPEEEVVEERKVAIEVE